MFRLFIPVLRAIKPCVTPYLRSSGVTLHKNIQLFSTLQKTLTNNNSPSMLDGKLTINQKILDVSRNIPPILTRTVTKFSIKKGKRKTVRPVIKKFFRLHWGGWIRTRCGRQKKLWKKSSANKRRLREHVLVNSTQATLLDKMVTNFWKRRKHYVDDPYEPYHSREEFMITRKKPLIRD